MKNTFVREWMTANPVSCSSDTTVPDAHKIMTERRIRRLLVVDHGHLVGIVTRGDVRGAEPSGATTLSIYELNYLLAKLTIGQIMTKDPASVTPETSIQQAAALMLEKKIAGLPVVDQGRLVGIITESDIFRMVVKIWSEEETR
ncbi:MAG: CBS domain-containing protein [Anaerolineales bacterium]|nr:CBS domain-containing protein [Anaerolineales bacterium]